MTIHRLIELALGPEEAKKVDTAIPQAVHDELVRLKQHNNVAGWYYDKDNKLFGRLLKQTECWAKIGQRIQNKELEVRMLVEDGADYFCGQPREAGTWPCLSYHVEKGHAEVVEA